MPKDLQSATVLIAGAAGFVGSHLVDKFLSAGARVVGVDNLITGQKSNLDHILSDQALNKKFQLIEADVAQPAANYLPSEIKFDYVLHFASPASPPRYQAHPVETYMVNTLGTHYLLAYLKQTNPSGVMVMASSSEVYGEPQVHPQVESYWGNVNPNGIRSCYDEGKRMAETVCGVFNRDFKLDVRIVRIFNTYGPRMDLKDGRVIPQFIKAGLNKKAYPIYGDGKQTRSYCFVDDLVEGIFKLATLPNLSGKTVNLGNPQERTVMETAQAVHQTMFGTDTQPQFEYHPMPGDDPSRRCPDITLAKQLLDWEPKVDFATGLQKTVEYFRK